MWFKKLLIKLTIKVLIWLKDKDFGDIDKVIDKIIDQGIDALNSIIKSWHDIKK